MEARRSQTCLQAPMRQLTRNQYRLKLRKQKLMGVSMLIMSAAFLLMCAGTSEDCTAVLITAPLGLLLLFSKEIWIM